MFEYLGPDLDLGDLLASLRNRAGMTQEELAVASGLSVRSISDIERSRVSRPRRRSLELLSEALGLDTGQAEALVARSRQVPLTWPEAGADGAWPAGAAARRRQKAPPRQLPAVTSGFAGRSAQLRMLDQWHDRVSREVGTSPAIVITGAAGVGKTTLALQWAHQAAARFPDGQLWLNLRGFDPAAAPLKPPEAIRTLLEALNVPAGQLPVMLDAQVGLYRSLLAGKRVLVMLDNARDTSQVRPLLPGSPHCLVMITSRVRLSGLAAIEGARGLVLDVLSSGEARQLLERRLGSRRVAAEPEAADELIRLCAALPLALAVTAARARPSAGLKLATLAAELCDARTRPDALNGGELASSLRSVLASSYRQLPVAAARMFRLLGLHSGPSISLAAASSLAAISPRQAGQLLRRLSDERMLAEQEPGRYTLHDLLGAYARELAAQEESPVSRYAARKRLLDHYVHTASSAMLQVSNLPHPFALAPPSSGVTAEEITSAGQALEWFTAERPVLHETVAQVADAGFPGHAWRIAAALGTFLNRSARPQEAIGVLSIAQRTVEDSDDLGQAHIHVQLGGAHTALGSHPAAGIHLGEALRRFAALDDAAGQAIAYQLLNVACDQQGFHQQALEHARLALRMFRRAGDPRGEAGTLNSVGLMLLRLGDYRQGLDTCREALDLSTRRGFRALEAETWGSIGYAHHHLGHYDEALASYRKALDLHRQAGKSYYAADTLVHMGDACQAAGQLKPAYEAWQSALEILTELDHPDVAGIEHRLSSLAGHGDQHR
jgi:tetratricopeptide (TPR) repeat protein/transcriptional regulator with XRE-family HTH domain